uniref:PDZ domain-containing protein n=2 Tax=Anopheles albimanus TaxID=7167 RepID=A0A182FVI6_ANOAL
MPDDPEATSPKGEYAFDNPAFKTENGGVGGAGPATGNGGGLVGGAAPAAAGGTANSNSSKTGSPLDPSWTSKQNTIEKRKTVDDSYVNVTTPRLVSLRGSDFTGLGVEVYGGLKEGIFVRKVMPQGPAAGLVNTGDRITSITIDFRHIVQEDAMTILSYASPYNVQLELVGGTKPVLGPQTQSPKPGHQSLTHPLYRSSSQSDLNTIERNSRKKLFPAEDSPLKMDNRAASPSSLAKAPATVHKEHEREPKKHSFKQQMREMIEETFQTRHAPSADGERTKSTAAGATAEEPSTQKKGHKFGIRVFPPSVNDKLFGKSPTKVQADNENNTNIERKESGAGEPQAKERTTSTASTPPPVVKKRTKEPKPVPDVVGTTMTTTMTTSSVSVTGTEAAPPMGEAPAPEQTGFQRQNSLTSSGIRRDAAGIPQEMPSFMMQAANAARDNRKSAVTVVPAAVEADGKRKGKAPPRPPHGGGGEMAADLDASTVTMDTNLSRSTDETDGAASRQLNGSLDSKRMNFSDNFAEEVLNCTIDSIEQFELGGSAAARGPSNSSTPKSERKKASSLTESEIMMQRSDSLEELHNGHESDVEQEQRRMVSRGNKIELNSSDITIHQSSPSPTPEATDRVPDSADSERRSAQDEEDPDESNRRTASLGDLSRLNTPDNTLERAQSLEITGETVAATGTPAMTTVTVVNGVAADASLQSSSPDAAGEHQVANGMRHDGMLDGLSSLQRNRLKGASAWGNLEDAIYSGELLANGDAPVIGADGDRGDDDVKIVVRENGYSSEPHGPRKPSPAIIVAEAKKIDSVTVGTGGTTLIVGSISASDPSTTTTTTVTEEHISLTTINAATMDSYPVRNETEPMGGGESHLVKIGGNQYDTNIPDDVKVSRYPFGSLERPKSDVLKKLLGQKEELENTPSVFISADGPESGPASSSVVGVSKIRIESHRSMDVGEPISLTLINAPPTAEVTATIGGPSPSPFPESERTESSQPSPVFTSNTNGVSSINISSLEYDSGTFAGKQPMANGAGAKFSLHDNNIVTITTALDGGSGSQPSSIIMIDDEKLDFSLQTLDDFDEPLGDEPLGMAPPPPPPLDFAGGAGHSDSLEQVEVRKAPEPGTGPLPPLPSQRSSIVSMNGGTPAVMNGTAANGGFVTEITLKPAAAPVSLDEPEPEQQQQQQQPPQPAERPAQNGTIHQVAAAAPVAPSPTTHGKPPIISKKPPKPEHKPTTPPSRIPVERRMSSEHSFIPRNAEIKFTTATYESPASGPRTPPTRPLGVDQIRSAFERSNSKTEIPVLIRRTSIPSINLSGSMIGSNSSNSSSSSSNSTTGGSMSNLSNLTSASPNGATKASPSRIPVFSSSSALAGTAATASSKFGAHDVNGGRSPPPATINGGTSPHHHQNGHHHSSSSNNHLVNNSSSKMSVSIHSIKNQSKHPSGKY